MKEKKYQLFMYFIFNLILFSLMPLILIIIAVFFYKIKIPWGQALFDGGTLTFTFTTISSYMYYHIVKGSKNVLINLFTMVAIVISILSGAIFFNIYCNKGQAQQGLFASNKFFLGQLIVGVFAILYAVLVEAHLGGFKSTIQNEPLD